MLLVTSPDCTAASTVAISAERYLAPINQSSPEINVTAEIARNAAFIFEWPAMSPKSGGAIALPSAYITKMLNPNAIARTEGGETFAIAVFAGPMLKKMKNKAPNSRVQAQGKAAYSIVASN